MQFDFIFIFTTRKLHFCGIHTKLCPCISSATQKNQFIFAKWHVDKNTLGCTQSTSLENHVFIVIFLTNISKARRCKSYKIFHFYIEPTFILDYDIFAKHINSSLSPFVFCTWLCISRFWIHFLKHIFPQIFNLFHLWKTSNCCLDAVLHKN